VRHVRMLGLCLVALFALTAVAAVGSASAANPEWGACIEAKKGHYEDSSCTKEKFKESKGVKKYLGKYEWKAGAPAAPECIAKKHGNYLTSACNTEKEKKGVPEEGKGKYEKGGPHFTGEGGAGLLWEYLYGCEQAEWNPAHMNIPHAGCTGAEYGLDGASAANVECTAEHAEGDAVGSSGVENVSVRFTGCSYEEEPATSPGHPAGEILVNKLKGHLGYINQAKHEVGVLLEPATKGGEFAYFLISNGEGEVHVGVGNATEGAFYETSGGSPTGNDAVISPITPINQMTKTFTQNYRVERIKPYLPVSCGVSHTCPLGTEAEWVGGRQPSEDVVNVPSKFEGGPFDGLEVENRSTDGTEVFPWVPAGEEITNVNTVEGEAEIKA
jgi:hypothetical protein